MAETAYTTDNTSNGFIASNLGESIKAKVGTYNIWTKTGTDALIEDWFNLLTIIMNQKFSGFPPMPQPTQKPKHFSNALLQNGNLVTPMTMLARVTGRCSPYYNKGYASVYVDGVLDGTTKFYFPGKKIIPAIHWPWVWKQPWSEYDN